MVIDSNALLGHSLGNCILQRLIGRGGMGAVYLAQQTRPRRLVAVKVLMPSILMETRPRAEFLTRFRREADAVAALDHVNIMPVYEYDEQDDLAYIVMPYVTGGTLRTRLEQKGKLPLEEALHILEQAASALDCAHAQGIVHRDLKPGNMLFHADGRVLLADFGLAKIIKDVSELGTGNTPATALTSTGAIIGTPEYLSPEQGTGHAVDYRSDVYSLGVVLFHMLTGRVPFTGTSAVSIAIKHAMEPPPLPSQLNPALPTNVDAVVLKALAKQPEQRYTSAGELARALRAAIDPHQAPATYYTTVPIHNEHETPLVLSNEAVLETSPATLNSASTEEAPRMEPPKSAEPPLSPQTHLPDVPVEYQPTVVAHSTKAAQPEIPANSSLERRAATTKVGKPPKGERQPLNMILLSTIIVLLLIISGFAAYLHFAPTQHNTAQKPAVTAPSAITPTPYAAPKASIAAGQLLYATPLPGAKCDRYGGAWDTQSNAIVKCLSNGVTLGNTSSSYLAGIFLNQLPNGQSFPNDYIIQVQVSHVSGNFGIFFRNQPGSQAGGYAFLISSDGYWQGDVYDNKTGAANTLHAQQGTMAINNGPVTIDVLVQGNIFKVYFNGVWQGSIESGAYPTGTVGLVIDTSSTVTYSNFELYAI